MRSINDNFLSISSEGLLSFAVVVVVDFIKLSRPVLQLLLLLLLLLLVLVLVLVVFIFGVVASVLMHPINNIFTSGSTNKLDIKLYSNEREENK